MTRPVEKVVIAFETGFCYNESKYRKFI
jgi:hypothetical protein